MIETLKECKNMVNKMFIPNKNKKNNIYSLIHRINQYSTNYTLFPGNYKKKCIFISYFNHTLY